MPDTTTDLVTLEKQGWQALTTDGTAAAAFYDHIVDDEIVMLLPGGLVIDERARAIEAMSGQPWASFRLEHVQVRTLTGDVAAVTYGVVAQREGEDVYSALIGSTYVRRDGGWRLAIHQQTPR